MDEGYHPERIGEQIDARNSIIFLYRLLYEENRKDCTNMFILMATLQLNYTQEEVASMLGTTQENVSKRLKTARKILKSKQGEVIL